MEYTVGSRLYMQLSEFIFRCKKNDVDYNIAMVLLEKVKDFSKMEDFSEVNITEVAYLSNTTPASVPRFCKKIGYLSFFDLKNDVGVFSTKPLLDKFPVGLSVDEQKNNFLKHSREIDQVILEAIDSHQLDEIVLRF